MRREGALALLLHLRRNHAVIGDDADASDGKALPQPVDDRQQRGDGDDRGTRSAQARIHSRRAERSDAIVRRIVLENDAPFTPLLVERQTGETQLFVKQVKIEGKRYIVCRNEAEAEKDRKDREAIVAALDAN
jgi:hypothetical protein